MLKRANYKRIINEIISNGSPAAIMLTESDGNTVAFFSELNNFFKRSFWMNPTCDDFYSFAVTFAKKVFSDSPEEYARILQFKHCEYGFNKDSIILKEALKKIASIYGDCLLVLDNLETLRGDFDMRVIEYILKNSPRNLKIVLVSRDFLNINYNIFTDQCPKLIEINADGDEYCSSELLTTDESKLLDYTACLRFVDVGFLRPPYANLMESLAKKRPEFVMRRGTDCYCVNEKYSENGLSSENGGKSGIASAQEEYFRYLRDSGKVIEAFIFALNINSDEAVDDIVKAIISNGMYTFELCNFVKSNKDVMKDYTQYEGKENNPCLGLTFLTGLQLYYRGDYDESTKAFETVSQTAQRGSKLEADSIYMIMKNYGKQGRYEEVIELLTNLIEERTNDGTFSADVFEMILCKLPEFLKTGEIPTNSENGKVLENLILKDEYKNRYWYAKALQAAAELHFDWGSYGKATEYIRKLQELIPFYTIPYRLMGFYYYMGDMFHAVSMAKKALEEELSNDIAADLVDVYTLLAKTSVYFNKFGEGLEYIDNAIKSVPAYDSAKYAAYTLRAIICAKIGRRDYAKDYAMLYAKYAEINSPKNAYYLYGAVAYCSFRSNDFDTAAIYANKCIKEASSRSGIWLISVAVAINVLLAREDAAGKVRALMEKLFRSCRVYGMHAIVLDYYECFEKLLKYARSEGFDVDYVEEIEKMYETKLMQISANGELNVKLMGTTSVTVAGKELNWKTKKAKELFLMYVWHKGEGLDRNFILSTLWNDYVYVSAINNLKTTNNIIRKTLTAANVMHKLIYANGKYSIELNNIQCDYTVFYDKLLSYDDTAPIKKRVDTCKELLSGLNGDFAAEISLPVFRKHGAGLKEKIMLDVIKLISELVEEGDIIEARRLLSMAVKGDYDNTYGELLAEQERKISDYFEGKE